MYNRTLQVRELSLKEFNDFPKATQLLEEEPPFCIRFQF